ncbi:MAG: iron-sulfur cluster assembly accessory protein [Chloroflexota bacterium]|nr:iron-sulfur cluster assembly accessory protein [Chloroflexota bacterium]
MAIDTEKMASKTANTDLVTISESAVSQLHELIGQQVDASPNMGLRVFVYPGGCSGMSYGMAFEDQPADDDLTIEMHGVKLYLDELSAQYVAGAEIDYENSLMGGGFRILNPNAVRTCGCGHSFDTGADAGNARGCGCGH